MPYSPAGRATNIAQRRALADARARLVAPMLQEILESGACTFRAIAKQLNERGSTTPRGNEWSDVQVRRVLARLKGL